MMKISQLKTGKVVSLNTSAEGHRQDDHKPGKITGFCDTVHTNFYGVEYVWVSVDLGYRTITAPSNRLY